MNPDLTDPNPPPQAAAGANPAIPGGAEHLSTIQSASAPAPVAVAAAATPPAPAATHRPSPIPPPPAARPDKPVAHGGPTRQFLNQNITPHLLEGMKYVAVYEPDKPLLWLSNFLKERSAEVEGA